MENREYWYWFSRFGGLGAAEKRRLLSLLGSPEAIFRENRLPIADAQRETVAAEKKKLAFYLQELEELPRRGLAWACPEDEDYPDRLRPIADPPFGLYRRGDFPSEDVPTVGIVGARRCSSYGEMMAEHFGKELGKAGLQIISGMAMGIDSRAQSAALAAGGRSFALLGSGADVCYPSAARGLYEHLPGQGGVISELPPGSEALPFHFPLRNRLISALSDVLLVIEAREKSGSLITVDHALEQGKDVLALPGRVGDGLSEGCNRLIRQGAGILIAAEDVFAALGLPLPAAAPKQQLSAAQRTLLSFLGSTPVHIETLAVQSRFSLGELSLLLMELEGRGLVRSVTAGQYIRLKT